MSTITQPAALPLGTWSLDPAHSRVGFAVEYLGGTFRGTFSPVEATLASDGGSAELTGLARADAIQVQDENLETHLLSPDFFDAERTPELTFAAREIRREGDEVVAAGELTIKGVTQPVELRGSLAEGIVDAYERERIRLTLTGTVDRTAFGLNWNVPLPSGEPALAEQVELEAELFFIKA